MKKVLALFLALILCLSLCACSGVNKTIKEVEEQIASNRTGELSAFYIHFPSEVAGNKKFEAFLQEKVTELCQNKEYTMLCSLLGELDDGDIHSQAVVDALNNYCNESGDIVGALALIYELRYCTSYRDMLNLNRNTGVLSTYISKTGTNSITMQPGEGYYADKEDTKKYERVGVEGSNLYNQKNTTYLGDFKCVESSGMRLNKYYEEEYYSETVWYFRGTSIGFSPDMAEFVWSGDYLFCFSNDGNLLEMYK